MKKIFALILVLALTLSFAAFAEQRTYIMAAISDADGNVLASLTDDGSAVLDADGNDITDDYPVLVLLVDNESKACAFGTEDDAISGTFEITAEDAETGVDELTFTLEDGEVLTMYYVAGEDTFSYTADSLDYYFMNMDMFA